MGVARAPSRSRSPSTTAPSSFTGSPSRRSLARSPAARTACRARAIEWAIHHPTVYASRLLFRPFSVVPSPAERRMSPKPRQHVILVGNQQVALPEGVTALDWSLERINYQNPRIRSFLGCIRLIEGVLESNYALLHCSPERLLDIWGKVRQVASLIRTQLSPAARGRLAHPPPGGGPAERRHGPLDARRPRAARARPLPGRRAAGPAHGGPQAALRLDRPDPLLPARHLRRGHGEPIRGACTTPTTSSPGASRATSRRPSGSTPP